MGNYKMPPSMNMRKALNAPDEDVPTFKQLKGRLDKLGYLFLRHQWEPVWRRFKVPYLTAPAHSGGSTNGFMNLREVWGYVMNVEQVRQWQEDYDEKHSD